MKKHFIFAVILCLSALIIITVSLESAGSNALVGRWDSACLCDPDGNCIEGNYTKGFLLFTNTGTFLTGNYEIVMKGQFKISGKKIILKSEKEKKANELTIIKKSGDEIVLRTSQSSELYKFAKSTVTAINPKAILGVWKLIGTGCSESGDCELAGERNVSANITANGFILFNEEGQKLKFSYKIYDSIIELSPPSGMKKPMYAHIENLTENDALVNFNGRVSKFQKTE